MSSKICKAPYHAQKDSIKQTTKWCCTSGGSVAGLQSLFQYPALIAGVTEKLLAFTECCRIPFAPVNLLANKNGADILAFEFTTINEYLAVHC